MPNTIGEAFPILEITDGTPENTISFLSPTRGVHLHDWIPQLARYKGGGVVQSQAMSPGAQLVYKQFDLTQESFDFDVDDLTIDSLSAKMEKLFDLLEKATDFFVSGWLRKPVYLRVQPAYATRLQYALIANYSPGGLNNPFSSPMGRDAQASDMLLEVSRDHWMDLPPGQRECAYSTDQRPLPFTDAQVADSVMSPVSFATTPAGWIVAAGVAQNRRSNNGSVWSSAATPFAGTGYAMAYNSVTGLLYAATSTGIYSSADNGNIWIARDVTFGISKLGGFIMGRDGYMYAQNVTATSIVRSNTGWVSKATVLSGVAVNALYQDAAGTFWASATTLGKIYKSLNGSAWAETTRISATSIVNSFLQVGAYLYAFTGTGVYRTPALSSTPVWELVYTGLFIRSAYNPTNGYYYLSTSSTGGVWRTADMVEFEAVVYDGIQDIQNLGFFSDGVYATSSSGVILRLPTAINYQGRTRACGAEMHIVNSMSTGGLTMIKINDGGVVIPLWPMTLPSTLFPAVPAVGDALYFGSPLPFQNLIFNLLTPVTFTTTYQGAWEYWNGAAWSALTHTGTTNEAGLSSQQPLTKPGIGTIVWSAPIDWVSVVVDTTPARFYIRLRITVIGGSMTPPVQTEFPIYTATHPSIRVAADDVGGTIPALAGMKIANKSSGGFSSSWNRVVVGMRSTGRGVNFTPFLYPTLLSDMPGVTLSLGANTTQVADTTSPNAFKIVYNPAGAEAESMRAKWAISPALAMEYVGRFRVFAAVHRTAGAQTDFLVRAVIELGSDSLVAYSSPTRIVKGTVDYQVLEFGQCTLGTGIPKNKQDNLAGINVTITASAVSGVPNLEIHWVALMPIDEWSADVLAPTDHGTAFIGLVTQIRKQLEIDSTGDPTKTLTSVVSSYDSLESVYGIYDASRTNGPFILKPKTDQELWFLCLQRQGTAGINGYTAQPEITNSVVLYKNERFRGLRGTG